MSHFFVIAFEIRQGLAVLVIKTIFCYLYSLKKKNKQTNKQKKLELIEMIFPQKDLNYDVEYDIAVTATLE